MVKSDAQIRAQALIDEIKSACVVYGLDMTIYEDGIGFVDLKEKKIVAVWKPNFTILGPIKKGDGHVT